ncbi:signal peptidase II, partial [Escherichia coli]|nr:signal peptidase II [Escherichia coli]
GISLGLLTADSNASRWALVAMTGAIAVAVAFWMTRERSPVDQMALGCVLGGALGNIVDRVRLGYVVDFADLHFGEWWP